LAYDFLHLKQQFFDVLQLELAAAQLIIVVASQGVDPDANYQAPESSVVVGCQLKELGMATEDLAERWLYVLQRKQSELNSQVAAAEQAVSHQPVAVPVAFEASWLSRDYGEWLLLPVRTPGISRPDIGGNGSKHILNSHSVELGIFDPCTPRCASKAVSFQHSEVLLGNGYLRGGTWLHAEVEVSAAADASKLAADQMPIWQQQSY